MLRYASLTFISILALAATASAQYYPAQNQNLPRNAYFCPQHNTYCNHSQAQYGPPTYNSKCAPVGQIPPGHYYCQSHNQYCNHAPLNDPRYHPNQGHNNHNQGYYDPYYDGYQGGQYNSDQYYSNGGRRNPGPTYDNGGLRYPTNQYRGNNRNYRNQTPPPGHYYCQTHDMFCSH